MRPSRVSSLFCRLFVAASILSLFSLSATARSREHPIHAFSGRPDGSLPAAPLIADAEGNLYGTTFGGGANNLGCIFKLSRGGGWEETVLYSFSLIDGGSPAASLLFDELGNLYGTAGGGTYGGGVAFELSPASSGTWTETVLHNFGNGNDGYGPLSQLIFDDEGNLYGTSQFGGSHGGGTVYKLSPASGGWTETVLYDFPHPLSGPNAAVPVGGVILARNGHLFGNSGYGGVNGVGAVYELVPSQTGYKERVIHSFTVNDGLNPSSTLVLGPDGKFYGTTSFGGDLVNCPYVGCGTVFQLMKDSTGKWMESVIYALNGSGASLAVGPVAFDEAGNLYAAAQSGGLNIGDGSVFMLTPGDNGLWKKTVLHYFDYKFPNGLDGQSPYAGVIINRGHVFGTTSGGGGPANDGTVFEITR